MDKTIDAVVLLGTLMKSTNSKPPATNSRVVANHDNGGTTSAGRSDEHDVSYYLLFSLFYFHK